MKPVTKIRMDLEHWRLVPSCPSYCVSNWGNALSLKSGRIRRLTPSIGSHGYRSIYIGDNNVPKTARSRTVHSLVAEAFLGQRSSKEALVNHKDGNKLNNRLDNLELCTAHENNLHARRVLRKGKIIPVECVETGEVYPCIMDAAEAKKTSFGNIASVVRGQRSTAGGYHWRKIKDLKDERE